MPTSARIDITGSLAGLVVEISWPLNDDPNRFHKMSKAIAIYVSYEAAQDFADASEDVRSRVRGRVEHFLQTRLAAFDPTHNALKHVPPPTERWDITTQTIFG